MSDILAEILASKRDEVERAARDRPLEMLVARPAYRAPLRDFFGDVTASPPPINLIAEIKRRSPSAGVIRADFDHVQIARSYAAAGAAALSVLTDETFFGGRLEFMESVRAAVPLPILRKDFIIDEYQVHESRAYGADAILLIAEALAVEELVKLARLAQRAGLAVLIEVHSEEKLRSVIAALNAAQGGILLGINNRDLKRQVTDVTTTERLAAHVPPHFPIVAESGISTSADVSRMIAAGARAVLVGESLLRKPDLESAVRALLDGSIGSAPA